MTKEVWKDVIGYEGYYQVSNLGKIKSITRFTSHNRLLKEHLLKPAISKYGYYRVTLSKGNKKINKCIHRLIALVFIENPNNYPEVNHINGIKTDNRVENLEWVTCQQNIQHAFKMGLSFVQGSETHHKAKLTQKQVDYIRKNYKFRDKNFGATALAKKFGITPSTITLITKNKNWRKEK